MFKGLNVLAVLLTAAVLVLLRFAWYDHFAGVGWGDLPTHLINDVAADFKVTGLALVNALVLAGGLVWLIGQTGERSPAGGLLAGLAGFILFGLTTILQPYIFGGQLSGLSLPQALVIDGGYLLASFLVGGLLVGLMVRKRRSKTNAARHALFAEAQPDL